jgi:hypothetical protein
MSGTYVMMRLCPTPVDFVGAVGFVGVVGYGHLKKKDGWTSTKLSVFTLNIISLLSFDRASFRSLL